MKYYRKHGTTPLDGPTNLAITVNLVVYCLCFLHKRVEGVRSQPLAEFRRIQRWHASSGSGGRRCGSGCFLWCLLAHSALHFKQHEQTTVSTHNRHCNWVWRTRVSRRRIEKGEIDSFIPIGSRPGSAGDIRRAQRHYARFLYLRWWSPGKTPRTTLSMPSHSGGGPPPMDLFWPCVTCLVAIAAMRRRAEAAATE